MGLTRPDLTVLSGLDLLAVFLEGEVTDLAGLGEKTEASGLRGAGQLAALVLTQAGPQAQPNETDRGLGLPWDPGLAVLRRREDLPLLCAADWDRLARNSALAEGDRFWLR